MAKSQERTEAINRLKDIFKAGDTVHTIVRRVSRSGMSREISVIQILPTKETRQWDSLVARALDLPLGSEGVKISGCGMDMGFELVYQLGHVLFPTGTKSEKDGGYALKQRWL